MKAEEKEEGDRMKNRKKVEKEVLGNNRKMRKGWRKGVKRREEME